MVKPTNDQMQPQTALKKPSKQTPSVLEAVPLTLTCTHPSPCTSALLALLLSAAPLSSFGNFPTKKDIWDSE